MSEFDVLIQALVITVLTAVAYIMGRGDGWDIGFEDGCKYGYELRRLLDERGDWRSVRKTEWNGRAEQ